ncbi:hypothetical protein RFI_24153 [Reticulomyxa filosa]|uniref:Amino acid transporter transmembrane domain-containing protein n=1 Tax=Reticulomyxa filosa TaxID=46433 RepID=X6MIF0_RETFI|nr:hypothetical protein RFI_24153 [Reticulomyxa filosa]|eukprot:ETO13222.1 hypothetical protein RFI_24153 [Reticulomyxa filosa]
MCLNKGLAMYLSSKMTAGSMKGSIFNMILSTVGGGMLSLAYGVKQVGLVPGLLLLIFSCWLSYFTNDLLLLTTQHMPKGQTLSFLNLSRHCSPVWGERLAKFTQGMLIVQMFGQFISYEVAFGGLLDLVWTVVVNDSFVSFQHSYVYCIIQIHNATRHITITKKKTSIYVYAILIFTWGVIYPLSLLRQMSALRYTSLFGMMCSLYLGLVILIEYFILCNGEEIDLDSNSIHTCFWKGNFHLPNDAIANYDDMWSFIKRLLVSIPLFVFAYTSQQFMLPIYSELKKPSRQRMQKVLQRSSYIVVFIYICASGFGYLTFLGMCLCPSPPLPSLAFFLSHKVKSH